MSAERLASLSPAVARVLAPRLEAIGFATRDIAPGEHVHVHNLGAPTFAREYAIGVDVAEIRVRTRKRIVGWFRGDKTGEQKPAVREGS